MRATSSADGIEPVTIGRMDDFHNQLTAVVTTWREAGALASLILLVNLLTNLTKLQVFAEHVPPAARGWIAAGLGSVGAFLAALTSGKPLALAVMSGLVIGLGAIGVHELISKLKPTKRVTAGILAVAIALGVGSAAGCRTSTRKVIRDTIVDCTKPEVANVVQASTPVALALVDKLLRAHCPIQIAHVCSGVWRNV